MQDQAGALQRIRRILEPIADRGEEMQLAEVVTPPPAPVELAVAELPHTASWLPLIALFGLLALVGAWVMRRAQNA